MSVMVNDLPDTTGKKRKIEHETELEVDLNAPEPPSKKARRKAKSQRPPKNVRNADSGESVEAKALAAKRTKYGIWIGNLPFTATAIELNSFLTNDKVNVVAESQISRINMPQSGRAQNKGFAYVDFTDEAGLNAALQLSEKLFTGRRVLIKNAGDFEGRPDASKTDKKVNVLSTDRIFVGNLGFDATKEELRQHFEKCGVVRDVFVATFEDSGKCKGYAWVTFHEVSAAEAAMRGWVEVDDFKTGDGRAGKRRIWLNKLRGQKLRMEFAEDKATRYNKRFGKNARIKPADQDVEEDVENLSEKTTLKTAAPRPMKALKPHALLSEAQTNGQSTRYSDVTVTKLKGTIVLAEGKKTTFD